MDVPQVFKAEGERKKRVALLTGCAQRALNTDINEATIRLLTRHGCEVVIAKGMGCCGALTHHMGKTAESHASAAANIRAWMKVRNNGGLDAVVINTSGCGTRSRTMATCSRAIRWPKMPRQSLRWRRTSPR
jgi:glycolate oxidase iron-sulfur subunit